MRDISSVAPFSDLVVDLRLMQHIMNEIPNVYFVAYRKWSSLDRYKTCFQKFVSCCLFNIILCFQKKKGNIELSAPGEKMMIILQ